MKKLLLTLGAVAAVAAPVASVVACGAPAKPAPKAIDETAAKKLAGKIVTALTGGATSTVVPTVATQPDGNISIEFDMQGPDSANPTHMNIIITSTGEVVSAKDGTTDVDDDKLNMLKTMVKKATENHDNDSIPVSTEKESDFDATVVSNGKLIFPTLVNGPDHDEIDDYNNAVSAFGDAYRKEVVKEAIAFLNGQFILDMNRDEYQALDLGEFIKLDDSIMGKFHMSSSDIQKVNDFIKLGAVITITKKNTADVTGSVSDNGNSEQFGWLSTSDDIKNPGSLTFKDYTPATK